MAGGGLFEENMIEALLDLFDFLFNKLKLYVNPFAFLLNCSKFLILFPYVSSYFLD